MDEKFIPGDIKKFLDNNAKQKVVLDEAEKDLYEYILEDNPDYSMEEVLIISNMISLLLKLFDKQDEGLLKYHSKMQKINKD